MERHTFMKNLGLQSKCNLSLIESLVCLGYERMPTLLQVVLTTIFIHDFLELLVIFSPSGVFFVNQP